MERVEGTDLVHECRSDGRVLVAVAWRLSLEEGA